MPRPSVRTFPNTESLIETLAHEVVDLIRDVVQERGRFLLALAGGNTPKALYQRLGTQYAKAVPWSRVQLFWGDERYVPLDHPSSNYRMAHESLISRLDIPPGNVHPIPTQFEDPDEASRVYQAKLQDIFKSEAPAFDLLLLGMGADGHTASLFPGTPAVGEQSRWVVPGQAPVEPHLRVTMTIPVILQARKIYFLIAGKDKAETLHHVFHDRDAVNRYPTARIIDSVPDKVTCWTDEAAMG